MQAAIDQIANDFTQQGNNPGGISNEVLNTPGGGGGAYTGGAGGSALAFNPYTSPYIKPRQVFFTINTFTNLSREGVLAKAYLNDVEVENQYSTKGKITFSIEEQRLLNACTLKVVSGDLKAQRYFLVQARADNEGEVSIIEYDIATTEIGTTQVAPTPDVSGYPDTTMGGGRGGGGGGGQFDTQSLYGFNDYNNSRVFANAPDNMAQK